MTGTTPTAAASSLPAGGGPHWRAPFAERPVDATVTVPGSKSLTNRTWSWPPSRTALPVARPVALPGLSADDRGLRHLGATISEVPETAPTARTWRSAPSPAARPQRTPRLTAAWPGRSCALCATGRTAPGRGPVRRRPARPQTPDGHHHRGPGRTRRGGQRPDGGAAASLPFTVRGTGEVRGGHLIIDASASSQFVSALLLAGARFTEGLHLEHRSSAHPGRPCRAWTTLT